MSLECCNEFQRGEIEGWRLLASRMPQRWDFIALDYIT